MPVARALERELLGGAWDIIGSSTTGMTLRFDLELAHVARRMQPHALLLAGGMEATFRPELMFGLGPFDCVVLGEGERPLLELVARLRAGAPLKGVTGTAERGADGQCLTMRQQALTRTELRDAIFHTPYESMPYAAYWERLERAHVARRMQPHALLLAGGMEATFRPELMFGLGPFDCVVLGEGEHDAIERPE